MLAELSRAKRAGAAFVAHAPAAVVVAVDEDIDTWVEDGSIALAYMHLVASDLGIGSC
jgi:nitroreductase